MQKNKFSIKWMIVVFIFPLYAQAWWAGGHELIARTAVHALPKSIPEFFRNSEEEIAQSSTDPDVVKISGTHALRAREEPAHFIDLELLQGVPLPSQYEDYLKLLIEKKIDFQKIGFLPYSILEWTERLSVCFAEYRKFKTSRVVRTKCALTAGVLAHYVGDLHQPLHTTIHHDGKITEQGLQDKGIHSQVDGLLEKLKMKPGQVRQVMVKVEAIEDTFQQVVRELNQSHAEVDGVYQMVELIKSAPNSFERADPKLKLWALDRSRAASLFLARLYVTAWIQSQKIELPSWVIRR